MKDFIREWKTFLILWSTQALSQLGSAMTNFALIIWLYQRTGSALQTALLSICSYAPYVAVSIFAGALADRWDRKRVMLVCDTLAAASTVAVLVLLKTGRLAPAHMYVLNALNGLMGSVQSPASDVAMSLIIPKKHYQRASGLRSFSNSLVTILTPMLASMILAFAGMDAVILVDLATFAAAFLALLLFVEIPKTGGDSEAREPFGKLVRGGLQYLNRNRLILYLILFLAGVNLVASAFDAVLPALILPRKNGGEMALGTVQAFAGVATLAGSLIAVLMPAPKDRVRVIIATMLFSLGTENFLIALGRTPAVWCIAQLFGWLPVPLMSANLDVILRTTIPPELQGRVFACRNTLQFFTIPLGFFLGGALVDGAFEPLMARQPADGPLALLFGTGKGSGASATMFLLGVAGVAVCLIFGKILRAQQRKTQ